MRVGKERKGGACHCGAACNQANDCEVAFPLLHDGGPAPDQSFVPLIHTHCVQVCPELMPVCSFFLQVSHMWLCVPVMSAAVFCRHGLCNACMWWPGALPRRAA